MQFHLDITNLAERQELRVNDLFFCQQNQYTEPTAGNDGVSFSGVPFLKRFVVTTSIVALGTVSYAGRHSNVAETFRDLVIVLPDTLQKRAETAKERYAWLKREIVASGIPLLADDELRAEIRDRKGAREGSES